MLEKDLLNHIKSFMSGDTKRPDLTKKLFALTHSEVISRFAAKSSIPSKYAYIDCFNSIANDMNDIIINNEIEIVSIENFIQYLIVSFISIAENTQSKLSLQEAMLDLGLEEDYKIQVKEIANAMSKQTPLN